jgi:hypothetical protein
MGRKSLLMILGIGICGLGAMGFLTKFALESNPSLLRIGKLKKALAEDFSSQGVEAVSVRSLPHNRGFDVRIEAPKENMPNPEAFARVAAESFLRRYAGPSQPYLKLSLVEPSGWGCRGPETYFENEISLAELSRELELRAAIHRMEAGLGAQKGFRVLAWEPREPLWIKLEVPPPRAEGDLDRSVDFIRSKAREHLAAGSGRAVVMEVWSVGPEAVLLKEERLEKPQRRRQVLPSGPPPTTPGSPGPRK